MATATASGEGVPVAKGLVAEQDGAQGHQAGQLNSAAESSDDVGAGRVRKAGRIPAGHPMVVAESAAAAAPGEEWGAPVAGGVMMACVATRKGVADGQVLQI